MNQPECAYPLAVGQGLQMIPSGLVLRLSSLGRSERLGNDAIVLGMGTDPDPLDTSLGLDTQCPVMGSDSHRPQLTNLFEVKRRMV